MIRIILITLLFFAVLTGQLNAEDSSGSGGRHLLFFDTGGLFGGEKELPYYDESFFRLYSEAGYEFEISKRMDRRGNRYGLAFTGALGSGDIRVGVSPRITMQLNPRWAVQGSTGPVWSSEEEESGLFDRGWQVRGGLLYKDTASLTILWQALPYTLPLQDDESGTLHSIYAGVMIHGKPGLIVSLVAWGIIVVVLGIVLLTNPPY